MNATPVAAPTPSHPSSGRLPHAGARQVAKELARSLGGRRARLALVVLVLTAGAGFGLVAPAALGRMVDVVLGNPGASVAPGAAGIWWLGAAMVVAAVLGAALTAFGVILTSRIFETALARLRERMVSRALCLPQSMVERAGTGDLISRASDDVARVAEAVPRVVPALSTSLFTIVLTVAGMALLDFRFAVALLLIIPIHVLTVRWYLRRAPRIYATERAATAERAHLVLAGLRGRDTVHAFGLAGEQNRKIARASWEVVRWTMRARTVQNGFFGRLNLAEFVGMAAILAIGFALVGSGETTVGTTTAAMLFFLRLFGPINMLLFVVDQLQSALASLSRIVGVIGIPDVPPAGGARGGPGLGTPGQDPGARRAAQSGPVLRLAGVGYSYTPGHSVLCGIDLEIRRGEHVALVGSSGAGKTTLAALVAGIHPPTTGQVLHDPDQRTALVTQEVHVFTGTLRDNLTLADPGADDGHLRAALERVGADVLLSTLPDGLDTALGVQGHALAPAEAQHLALARLVLLDPELAVLDEATAEAGSANAGLLDRATTAALEGRAALIVAHRLNQAATADRILVMEDGRIVEAGTHAELAAAGGLYSRLWQEWAMHR